MNLSTNPFLLSDATAGSYRKVSDSFTYGIDKLCTICHVILKDSDSSHSIFSTLQELGSSMNVLQVLQSFSNFNFYNGPQMVCTSCYHKTIDVYKFIQMCNKAHEYMQHYLKNVGDETGVHVKIEEISVARTRIMVDGREFVDEMENEKICKFDELGMVNFCKVEEIILEEGIVKEETSYNEEITISHTEIVNEEETDSTAFDNLGVDNINSQMHDVRMGLIKCMDCHLVFSDKNELDDHRKEAKHTIEKPFLIDVRHSLFETKYNLDRETDVVCLECQEVFCNDKQLKIHMGKSHRKKHLCNDCGKVFPTPFSLIRHIRVHTGEKPFTCLICKRGFASSSALNRHTPTHNEVKIKPHKCQQCDQRFTQAAALRRHLGIHNEVKAHKCEQCDKGFTRADSLREHMHIHNGVKPHKCEQCDQRFTRASFLKSHMDIHNGVKPYKCEQCDRRFTQAAHLHTHIKRHKGVKAHKCEQCDRRFVMLGDLRVHMNIHNEVKAYQCEQCDRRFTQAAHLRLHMDIHNGIKAHKCEQCDRRFRQAGDLRSHMLIHSGVKAYKCEQCDRRFTHVSGLRNHVDMHNGIKAHKCEQCDRRFSRAANLKRHMDIGHT